MLENALRPEPLDELFERLAVRQYTRELLFSTVVATMTLVACRLYKSPRAVYTENQDDFGVTLKCFYEKLQGIELHVMRAMVQDHARRCAAIIAELGGQVPALLPGYRVKILDGNALAGTDHRIKELRRSTAAAVCPPKGRRPSLRVAARLRILQAAQEQRQGWQGRARQAVAVDHHGHSRACVVPP